MPTTTRPSPMAVVAVQGFKPPPSSTWSRRCRLRSFPHPDLLLELPANSCFPRSLSTPCFPTPSDPDGHSPRLELLAGLRSPPTLSLLVEAAVALASSPRPLVPASPSAFYLRNRSAAPFVVVKPVVPQRPETGAREVAAYLLDHAGFSGVPPTALVRIPGSRTAASIQRFVPHDFDAGELGPSRFSIASVHRIGILDVRLLNVDRHAGNILVKKGGLAAELIPIDHGLCLPEALDGPYFEWLHWPQAAVPFSDLECDYISSLDPDKDADILRRELPAVREPAIRILVLCTTFLKHAAAAGLCLADIGDMMTPGFEEDPSELESLCKQAEDSIAPLSSSSSSKSQSDISSDECRDYQFALDNDDGVIFDAVEVPMLLSSKPPVRSTCEAVLPPVKEAKDAEKDKVAAAITKSMSFSAAEFNYEGGGGSRSSRCISFKWMSEEEWVLFLQRFEELLPEALEARRNMGLKQRLGTSCKF